MQLVPDKRAWTCKRERPGPVPLQGRLALARPGDQADGGCEDLLRLAVLGLALSPHLYNDYLVGLLKHADEEALEASSPTRPRATRQTVVVQTAEAAATRSAATAPTLVRPDPRRGGPGRRAPLPRPHFDFDLATGRCLNARCEPLPVRSAASASTHEATG